MKTVLFLCVLGVLCVSAAYAQNTEFVAYRNGDPLPIIIGDQDGHKVLEKEYALPVHFGYPIRSYRILGTVIAHAPSTKNDDVAPSVAVRSIVTTAKLHGAEAVIMLRLPDHERLMETPDGQPWIIAKALAITWRMDGTVPKKPRAPR